MSKKEVKITLTKDQKKAVKECKAYINGTKYQDLDSVTVSGIGGSGKTLSTKYLVKDFPELTVLGIAISHAAVGQLSFGLDRECVTLAKALNKKPVINKVTGVKEFKIVASFFEQPMIADYDLLVIDECSMLSDQELAEIQQYKNDDAKVILLGDIAQLPPIEGVSPVSNSFNNTVVDLKEVMRFKHPLTELNLQYRDHIIDHIDNELPLNLDTLKFKDDINGLHNVETREALIQAYLDSYDPEQIDKCRIVAYRNKTVEAYNNVIRKQLLGDNQAQILRGDLIIANEPHRRGVIKNNEFLKVINVQAARFNGVKGFIIDLENNQKARISDVHVLDRSDMIGFYKELDKLKKKKKWKEFYKLKESFLNYNFAHCTTSHKMQGSTVSHVYVDVVDIMDVSKTKLLEKLQSIYVGISRAANHIFVFGANRKY